MVRIILQDGSRHMTGDWQLDGTTQFNASVGVGVAPGTLGGALDILATSNSDLLRIRNNQSGASVGTYLRLYNNSGTTNGMEVGLNSSGHSTASAGIVWNYENGAMLFGTNNTLRLTLSASAATLSFNGTGTVGPSTNNSLVLQTNNTSRVEIAADGTAMNFGSAAMTMGTTSSAALTFKANSTNRMQLNASGYWNYMTRLADSGSAVGDTWFSSDSDDLKWKNNAGTVENLSP